MRAWWRSVVGVVVFGLVPYAYGQVRDALAAAGFDTAWHALDLPDIIASVWQWMEAQPAAAVVSVVAIWLGALWTHKYASSLRHPIDRTYWLEAERALEKVPSEVTAICSQNEEGRVRWHLYPHGHHGAAVGSPRDRDRFSAEAHRLGLVVRRMRQLPRRVDTGPTDDPIDDWLNVVAGLVHPGEGFTGSGSSPDFGQHTTFEVRDVVRASRDACVMIANNRIARHEGGQIPPTTPSTSAPPKRARRRSYSKYLSRH